MKRTRRLTLPGSLIALVFLAHTLFYFFALGTDAVDDAYISFRYAQNAILGHGLFFNPGERVEGFTNFLWTALMIPLEGAHVDVGRASMLLGVVFGFATLWLVARFAKIVNAPRGAGILAALLLAVDGSFALWTVAGLETPLFAFLIFAGALLYVREQEWNTDEPRQTQIKNQRASASIRVQNGFPYSGIFLALAAMTRPEGLFVFAITVAHQGAWRLFTERRLATRQDLTRVLAFGTLFAPYWLGRWWYYKSFLPNSFYAKVAATGPAAQIERGWNHLNQFVAVHMGWIIALPPVVALWVSLRGTKTTKQSPRTVRTVHLPSKVAMPRFWTTYLLALLVPYAAYIVYVGGDWSVGRFFVPLLAPFYLLFSTGIMQIGSWLVNRFSQALRQHATYAAIVLGLSLGAGLFVFSSWNGEYGIYISGFDAANATLARETMGKWLHTNVPSGTLIAVDAAGQVPYFSELPAIDMFGINDLHIGRLNVATLGQGTPGHEKFDLGYVVGRAPTYVVIYGTLLDSVKEYERAPVSWTTNPALNKFLTLYRKRGIP